ncbi:MAG: zinc-ribbon domain-containing protein, partial [Candidatus Binatus sp.]
MIEIQCTSCHTRYRIDERVLPDDTPTFKCSRCGHVFNADPVPARARKAAPQAAESESQPARTIRAARPRAGVLKSPVESDVVKREHSAELRPSNPPEPEVRHEDGRREPEAGDPLNRPFGDREQKADTGENLKFDFSDERIDIGDAPPEDELERPEPDEGGWQVGDAPAEFESAPIRQAPAMMAEPEPAPRPASSP